jgi:hypothetical protein
LAMVSTRFLFLSLNPCFRFRLQDFSE